MTLPIICLKKNEERRIRFGHPWIFSNEINTDISPLKSFAIGELVRVVAHDQSPIGIAYVNPHSLITARLLTTDVNETVDQAFFVKRLQTARQLRELLFDKPFYRVCFSEADDLPGVVIDRYDKHLVVQMNTAGIQQLSESLIAALQTVFPDVQSILLRNDSAHDQEQLNKIVSSCIGTTPSEVLLEENTVKFLAPLLTGQKTGWFYDHRMNRARLKPYVKNKRVLDVFSYLGGFGIQAAVFGANEVTCVDASQTACDYILKNAVLNEVANKVHVICDDAFAALKKLVEDKKQYDVIIVDPPAFVKKAKDKKEGLIAYQRMNELALKLLSEDGILVSCSCSMQVSLSELITVIQRAGFNTKSHLQVIETGQQGGDHPLHLFVPETNYLKAVFLRKIAKKPI